MTVGLLQFDQCPLTATHQLAHQACLLVNVIYELILISRKMSLALSA